MNPNLEIINHVNLNDINKIHYYNKQNRAFGRIYDITNCYIKDKYLIVESKKESEVHFYALNLNQVYITNIIWIMKKICFLCLI